MGKVGSLDAPRSSAVMYGQTLMCIRNASIVTYRRAGFLRDIISHNIPQGLYYHSLNLFS